MKFKDYKSIIVRKPKPFLVLPSLDNKENLERMPKNPGLKLFTKTWPVRREKKKKDETEEKRPLTATLEEPSVLDIRLITKIDMSLVRKEFLNITNLCRFPLVITKSKRKKLGKAPRPLSLPPNDKPKLKHRSTDPYSAEDSWEDEENSIRSARKAKNGVKTKSVDGAAPKQNNAKKGASDTNNNKTIKVERKRALNVDKLPCEKNNVIKSTKLPEPCKTCGRADQPERFHSHPPTPLKPTKKMDTPVKCAVKNTVQKPVAMKYKSKQHNNDKKPAPQRKPSLPAQKIEHTPPSTAQPPGHTQTESPRPRSAKRTLTCYICGREFGTASLPLHEPKCLEKWERENSDLPPHLRRKPPIRPDKAASTEEWNQLAWEASQSKLIPCSNCGRTFFPDRLLVHQRSCKDPQGNIRSSTEVTTPDNVMANSSSNSSKPSSPLPPSVLCYICGRKFGTHSIKIHERQCLKKWHIENDSLPADMRSPPPTRKGRVVEEKVPVENATSLNPPTLHPPTEERAPNPKSPLFPCYLCGRMFSVNSIYIHEPQCLKMWRIENDKLPPSKRRKEPLKPDIKFTQDGRIDFEAASDANWQSHLSQLVPCKICSRKFNPDRVEIHERSCKG